MLGHYDRCLFRSWRGGTGPERDEIHQDGRYLVVGPHAVPDTHDPDGKGSRTRGLLGELLDLGHL